MTAPTCPRCGAPMLSLEQLAAIAIEADAARDRMRLAIPDALAVGIRALASALPCHAGLCRVKERAP